MRKFTVGLLYCALLTVYPLERAHLLDYWLDPADPSHNTTVIGNLTLVLLRHLFDLKRFVAHFSQYFQLLARMASLGPEMRLFLLKGKAVGRLMEFFYDEVSPHKDYFRDMADINPVYKELPDIGQPTTAVEKQMSAFQQLMERKRMKNMMDAVPKYKYLWDTVSMCMRSYSQHGEVKSPFTLGELVHFEEGLQQPEKDLFFPEAKFLRRVFLSAGAHTHSMLAVCQCYVHYVWYAQANPKEFKELLQVVQQGLTDGEFDEVKPYLVLTQKLIEACPERVEVILQNWLEVVIEQQQYYKWMETNFDFLFKICGRYPLARDWFRSHKSQWQFLIDWC